MIKVGSTYYWIGEYKDNANQMAAYMGHVTAPFIANTCYSSTDLKNWTFVNNVLTQQASGDLGPGRVVERPKVIFNDLTNTYVMYMHIDNNRYADARVGVARSPTVCGNYEYMGSFQPLGNLSRDMTLYKDDDGSGYLISGDHLNIYRLAPDFLTVASLVASANPSKSSESPAMVKVNGVYFLLTSSKTWWTSNDNYYFTAPALSGPWTDRGDFTPNSTNTYNSQTTYVLPVTGTSTTTYMYMGDRWCEGCFGDSTYIWQPLTINPATPLLRLDPFYDTWTIDTATGAWAASGPTATSTPTAGPTVAPTFQPPTATKKGGHP